MTVISAHSQPYYFRHYQVENGLSNNSVHSSIQDQNGFLWFGTKGGLNRFDGYNFKTIQLDSDNERQLNRDVIHCMYADDNGYIWVGTQRGLYRYDDTKEQVTYLNDSLREINDIEKDNNQNLWIVAGADLCRIDLKKNTVRVFPSSQYFVASSICRSRDGRLWFSSADGKIYSYNEKTNEFHGVSLFDNSPKAHYHWITRMIDAGNDELLVGTTSQGIKTFNTKTGTYRDLYTYNENRSPLYVRDIIEYAPGVFWFATESGIVILDRKTNKFSQLRRRFLDPYSLNDNAVYCLTKDLEGGVWAGTYFGGVNYYSRNFSVFQKYFPDFSDNSLGGTVVREIVEDNSGNIWIGTEDAGISSLDPRTGEIKNFTASGSNTDLAYTNVHGLMVNGKDLWVGTFENGLDVLDTKTGKVRKRYVAGNGPFDLKENFVVTLLKTKAGEIYVGTSTTLYRYDPNADGFIRVKEIPQYIFVSALFEDSDGRIWIGTHTRGVFNYDPATRSLVANHINDSRNSKSISNNTVNAIYEDVNKNIWISTEGGGICKLDASRKSFTRLTTKEGLPSNFVYKAIEDTHHKLWISTAKGLARWDPMTSTVQVFRRSSGLLNDQFNYNSGYRDTTGNLYFGSVKGMIRFHPDSITNSFFSAPVYLTGFQINNRELSVAADSNILKRSISMTDKIELDHSQSSFSIDFAALNFAAPEITEYAYIMEGLDDRETFIKSNRKVYFTDLSPGKYVFKVRAALNGNWSPKQAQLIIIIHPPFWATPWAFLLYVAVGLLIVYLIVQYYHRRHQERKEKEIYKAKIDFFTNITHEIRTPLTLIKGPLENIRETIDKENEIMEDVVTMERNTNRLLALLTQILDFRKTETKGFSLDFTTIDVVKVLTENTSNYKQIAAKKQVVYDIHIAPSSVLAEADEEAVNKILSNLLSNAFKYATSKVIVRMSHPANGYFAIEVLNDGYMIPVYMSESIFEPFFRIKETSKQKGNGIGLTLARSLAELHGGRLQLGKPEHDMNRFILEIPLNHAEDQRPTSKTILKKLASSIHKN